MRQAIVIEKVQVRDNPDCVLLFGEKYGESWMWSAFVWKGYFS